MPPMSTNIFQTKHTCPWWLCKAFDNPLRRIVHNPEKILAPFVKPGDTVLDIGCGMGYFTLALAQLVSEEGRVIAADLQAEMLEGLRQRASRDGLLERITLHRSEPTHIGVSGPVDFALAFWMVHEVRDQRTFMQEILGLLHSGGQFLLVEPRGHVSGKAFDDTVSLALKIGFKIGSNPEVRLSWASLLTK
jgi:ubiquinone/menaquinone biosynthesis C-methylase UbiE